MFIPILFLIPCARAMFSASAFRSPAEQDFDPVRARARFFETMECRLVPEVRKSKFCILKADSSAVSNDER